jgi:hypothetical protein
MRMTRWEVYIHLAAEAVNRNHADGEGEISGSNSVTRIVDFCYWPMWYGFGRARRGHEHRDRRSPVLEEVGWTGNMIGLCVALRQLRGLVRRGWKGRRGVVWYLYSRPFAGAKSSSGKLRRRWTCEWIHCVLSAWNSDIT